MRRSHMAMVAAGFFILTTGCVEMQRTCNSQEMITMKEKGFSVDQIGNMCTTYKVKEESVQAVADFMKAMATNATAQPAQAGSRNANASAFSNSGAAHCTTQYGSCSHGTRAPAGLMCQCQTAYGLIPGVTQ